MRCQPSSQSVSHVTNNSYWKRSHTSTRWLTQLLVHTTSRTWPTLSLLRHGSNSSLSKSKAVCTRWWPQVRYKRQWQLTWRLVWLMWLNAKRYCSALTNSLTSPRRQARRSKKQVVVAVAARPNQKVLSLPCQWLVLLRSLRPCVWRPKVLRNNQWHSCSPSVTWQCVLLVHNSLATSSHALVIK